jgi:hypothetical protein
MIVAGGREKFQINAEALAHAAPHFSVTTSCEPHVSTRRRGAHPSQKTGKDPDDGQVEVGRAPFLSEELEKNSNHEGRISVSSRDNVEPCVPALCDHNHRLLPHHDDDDEEPFQNNDEALFGFCRCRFWQRRPARLEQMEPVRM